ncbi:EF-hand calcium-binding domain-containing protein 6 [Plakobranchus ocellatus]|uniref:EF-hand calcium-binding domain-containing protein 6 n=1 Tax=Plakobranchus ocellatus TaxID=259542 RepID=A0AAV4D7W6_9GAST|nr:EF-hand calcium-binding domain-containing protein 6 [Plakobranchus ocellatus]
MASCATRRPQTPRTGSAKWGRPASRPSSRPLPVTHPMTTRSMDLDLTITGRPTPGLWTRREEEAPSRIVQWPPEHLRRPGKGKARVPKSTVWRTDNDLFEQVKSKLITGYEGVKQMFKAKDPYGNSIVSREGLFLILKALVGHISREQFDSFLKCICLHWRSSISFEEFIVRFHDNPDLAVHSVNGLSHRQQAPVQQQYQPHLEDNLRSTEMLEWCPFTSGPHAFVVFRKKLQRGDVAAGDILPPSCFLPDGRVIRPQLREALALCDLRLTDNEFNHVWLKFDPDLNGTIPTATFFKCLGLTSDGFPRTDPRSVRSALQVMRTGDDKRRQAAQQKRCKTEQQMHSTQVTKTFAGPAVLSTVDTVEIRGDRAEVICQGQPGRISKTTEEKKEEVEEKKTTTTTTVTTKRKKTTTTTTTKTTENGGSALVDDDKLAGHVRALIAAKRAPPQFDSVMDHLNYQFEETYRNLQSAFRLFDFMGDGYVARVDFRRVLREFGFDISAVDLDAFLARAGIGVVQGLINYKQFLHKFQSRGDSSLLARCMLSNNSNSLRQASRRIETEETLRAEKMESGVTNFFHDDYVKLLNLLKQKDKRNTGTVPALELRSAVNAVLKINMSDAQFGELLSRLTVSADVNNNNNNSKLAGPAINYSTFLDLLNSEPEHWNRRKDGHWTVLKYQLGDIAPATPVLRLQEKAKTWMGPSQEKDKASNSRVAEIRKELTKLFTDRFHVFDKSFQDMDRRKSGYMSKWQLGALIKLCGITLSVKDLDFLWATLDTAADNTLCYATLVKTFTNRNQQQLKQANTDKPRTAKSTTKPFAELKVTGSPINDVIQAGLESVQVEQPHVVSGSAKESRLVELLKKVRDDVLDRWEEMYACFLSLDRDGHASIAVQDMKDLMYKMKLPLSGPQRDELCNLFDLHANGWFHYVSFLHAIKKHTPGTHISPCVFDIHTKRLHRKAGPTSAALTLFDFLLEFKTLLLKKHKTLRSSFKMLDLNRSGFIEESELRSGFVQLGYTLSDQDFLDILQQFDLSQAQRISFDDFKTVLLTL